MLLYRLKNWLLQWKTDNDGDLALVIAKVLVITKYKEHAIISFKRPSTVMTDAGRWQGSERVNVIKQPVRPMQPSILLNKVYPRIKGGQLR